MLWETYSFIILHFWINHRKKKKKKKKTFKSKQDLARQMDTDSLQFFLKKLKLSKFMTFLASNRVKNAIY
jgi:hypothetical protein